MLAIDEDMFISIVKLVHVDIRGTAVLDKLWLNVSTGQLFCY